MTEGEWRVDEEGNLSAPGDLKPETDEFGRDDPDTLERERRRREREQQRVSKPRKERKPRRGRRKPAPEAEPVPPPAAPPTQVRSAPKPPKPPKPPRPPRAGNYRRRRFLALALVLVGLLGAWFLVAFFQPFAGDGTGHGSVTVEVPEGSSAGDIAKLLADKGVVPSARLFEWRLKLAGKSDQVQADTYTLAKGMSYGTAIDRLTGDKGTGATTVTIPEGLDRTQIAADVLPEGVSSDEYLKLTETAPKDFNPAQYGAKGRSLEGFLFPATYDLTATANGQSNVESLVQQQLQAFKDNIAKVDMSYAQKKNLTPYDVLIIASMIDKEVQVAKERPIVASVIYNRLSKGIPLGIDATSRFETHNYTQQLTNDVLQSDTPYNTRLNQGLTPTPIGNPGLAALKAAARPANTKFIYFVVNPGTCGEHFFTASEAEFEAKAAEYQRALQEQGGSPTQC